MFLASLVGSRDQIVTLSGDISNAAVVVILASINWCFLAP